MLNLTTEEKIDYIYNSIKKREKKELYSNIFKWGFRLFILLYLAYFYYFMLPSFIDNLKENLTPNFDKVDTEALFDKFKSLIDK